MASSTKAKPVSPILIHNQFLKIATAISPVLQQAITETGPVEFKHKREAPLVDVLSRAVVGQQLTARAASTIWHRVLDRADGASLNDYVASVEAQELRDCGLSMSKAKALQSIVAANSCNELDAEELAELDHAERTRRLTKIWGVGQWTADMVGIFYFGDQDIWPDGDLAVWRTLEKLTSRRRKTMRTAGHFAPYRTYLALYMWKIADT